MYATGSTQVALESSNLLSYIITSTFTDANWRGTTQSFILNWCDKLRKYEKLIPAKDHFTDPVKKIMLENAVRGVEDLHNVKTKGDHDVAHGKSPLTYQQYKHLLLSAAATHDEKLGLARTRNKQRVFLHDQSDNNDNFDIDTDVSMLEINTTGLFKDSPEIVKPKHEGDLQAEKSMPTFDPSDLIGRTFLLPSEKDGQRFRGEIIKAIVYKNRNLCNQPDRIKFRCSVNDKEFEKILTYNDIMNSIDKDETEHGVWKFKSISNHQGPLFKSDEEYKGSRYNVLVNYSR